GLQGISSIKKLDDSLKDPSQLQRFAERLQALHIKLCRQPIQFLLISEEAHLEQQYAGLQQSWLGQGKTEAAGESPRHLPLPEAEPAIPGQGWLANTQVNFCAKAFPTVPMNHPDAAPL